MHKHVNVDDNGMHGPGNDEMLTSIFGKTRPDKPSRPQRVKTGNIIKDGRDNNGVEQGTKTAVRTASDAIVSDYIETASAVTKSTVFGRKDATVIDNTVPENIFKKTIRCITARIYRSYRNDTEVLCSVLMPQ